MISFALPYASSTIIAGPLDGTSRQTALADVELLGTIEAKPDWALNFSERASYASTRVQLLLGSRAIHFVRGSCAIRNRGYQVQGAATCRASSRKSRQPAAIGRDV